MVFEEEEERSSMVVVGLPYEVLWWRYNLLKVVHGGEKGGEQKALSLSLLSVIFTKEMLTCAPGHSLSTQSGKIL